MPTFVTPSSFGTLREFNDCHAPHSGQFCSAPGAALTTKAKIPKDVPAYLHDLYLKAKQLKIPLSISPGGNAETQGEYTYAHTGMWGDRHGQRVTLSLNRGYDKFWHEMGKGVPHDELGDRATLAHELGHALYARVAPYEGKPKELPATVRAQIRQADRLVTAGKVPRHATYGTEFQAWRHAIRLDPAACTRKVIDENLRTYAEGLGLPERDHQRALDVLMRYRRRYSTLKEFNACHAPGSGQFCSGGGLTLGTRRPVRPPRAAPQRSRQDRTRATILRTAAKPLTLLQWFDAVRRVQEANDCHAPDSGQFCSKRSWHLTTNPNFVADPTRKPTLNRVFLSDLMQDDQPAGLFVTDDPEYWMQAHGYERPYVAEVEGVVTNRAARMGREEFMQGPVKTVRVLTIDEYAREKFGDAGWVEDHFDEGPKRGTLPKDYKARPVSDMTPAERKVWVRKFKQWRKRSR